MACLTRRNGHRIMRIDRICLEVVREGSQNQFVQNTSSLISTVFLCLICARDSIPPLIDVEIVLHLPISPVGQVFGIVVKRVETVTSNEGDSIRQDGYMFRHVR